jgi:hypothetical protein
VDAGNKGHAGKRRVREFRLEGKVVEKARRLDAEVALQPRPLGRIGYPFSKGEIDAQALKERNLPGPEHQRERSLPMVLITEMAQGLPLDLDFIAVESMIGSNKGN